MRPPPCALPALEHTRRRMAPPKLGTVKVKYSQSLSVLPRVDRSLQCIYMGERQTEDLKVPSSILG